jgi:putative heme-binding domain-containing protein
MAHTLDPNLSISSGFDLWSIELNNGEAFQGLIASESPSAITLRNVGAVDKTISRNEIKSINALGMSMMPGNLNEKISIDQMADLIAFLKSVN